MLLEIGALAGWAAGVGLAVLSALYILQARDVKRLREWAGGAPERSGPSASAVPGRSQRRSVVVLVGLLVLGGAAAYGVTQLTGDDGGDRFGDAQASAPSKPKRTVKPGNVTVAVLNGTMVPGLAAALSDQIAAAGFKKGMINDYPDKQLAESVVQYAPGRQAEAKAVSRRLGIGRREPVAPNARAIAADATVIVIAGADKAP